MDETSCHLHSLGTMREPPSALEAVKQSTDRVLHASKRRLNYASNVARRWRNGERAIEQQASNAAAQPFQPGDRVRVKSEEEVRRTLDDWDMLKGCGFMKEQWSYCGTEQVVFKHLKKFLDERDYKVKRVQHTYLLEDALCSGTDFGPCDRSCFLFWRGEWLEKID